MKLMRHHYLAFSITLIVCASMGEMNISQAREYVQGYSASDRYAQSQDNVWRSGTTFNNIRRVRYEREGAADNPWQANNNWRFDQSRSRERNWNNRPEENYSYERRARKGEPRSYNRKYRYENTRYRDAGYRDAGYRDASYRDTSYRDAYDFPNHSYGGLDSMRGYELDPVYGSPLMGSSPNPGLLYGAYPHRAYPYGRYPYSGGGFSPW